MAYGRKPKSTGKGRMYRKKRVYRKSSAIGVAKKALKLATKVANASTETKYLSYAVQTDLAGSGGTFNDAFNRQLTSTAGTTVLFNSDPLQGNKSYLKYIKGTWEIHMDNVNNEEETVNFTVAVIKFRQDADNMTSTNHVSTIQGQAYYDPRYCKLLYYKHFCLTGGGVQPAVTGPWVKTGHFYIPVKKMIRWANEGGAGGQTSTTPMSEQDKIYFIVHTDNTSADLENPRMNLRTLSVYLDNDINA